VAESVSEFLLKFAAALGVVMLVSFLSLGLRAGLIVALSVPLTLAIVFIVHAGDGDGAGARGSAR
jgi:multidrug efflux pump